MRVNAVPVSMLVAISIGFPFNPSSLLSCSCRYKAGFGLEPEPYRSGLHRNQHRAADGTEKAIAVQDPAEPLPILGWYALAGVGSAAGRVADAPAQLDAPPQVAPVARLDNAGMDRIAIPLWKSKQPISRLNKRTDDHSNLYNWLWAWGLARNPMNVRKIQPSTTSSWSRMDTRFTGRMLTRTLVQPG